MLSIFSSPLKAGENQGCHVTEVKTWETREMVRPASRTEKLGLRKKINDFTFRHVCLVDYQ